MNLIGKKMTVKRAVGALVSDGTKDIPAGTVGTLVSLRDLGEIACLDIGGKRHYVSAEALSPVRD